MKEEFEWIQSWCDHSDKNDLPRVLLVGDSITVGYQEFVREALRNKCYVDFIATSYAIDSDIYFSVINAIVNDSKYNLIHFNNGLHGIHISAKDYKTRLENILSILSQKSKIILANTTIVYTSGNTNTDTPWYPIVQERNEKLSEICKNNDYPLNDLFSISQTIKAEDRKEDGTHYKECGSKILAKAVVNKIKTELGI